MKLLSRLFAAAALTTAFSAQAADLPSRKGPPMAPIFLAYNWSGFYVGLQGGYQWGDHRNGLATPAFLDGVSYHPDGWMIGGHVGYNFQFNQIVVGVEGDLEWTNLKGSALYPGAAAPAGHSTEIDWQGSVRLRLGYAIDRLLIYATGGVAFAEVSHSVFAPGITLASYSDTRVGWTLGGGLEYAITNNITARAEYRYTDYGRYSTNFLVGGGIAAPVPVTVSDKLRTHAVRLGVSYKF